MQISMTFQIVLSTDGQHSFAALIYDDPATISSFLHESVRPLIVGFDSGNSFSSANAANFLLQNNETSEASILFRIDGT